MPRPLRFVVSALAVLSCVFLTLSRASADALSLTGSLASSNSVFTFTFAVGGVGTQDVVFQTWGFGGTNGGTNAVGMMISPGGFDPLLALFDGSGPSALLINGTADNQSNFGSFMGCPPAGTVAFSNGDDVCGDITMSFLLSPGTYTVTLSDANNVPNAFSDNGTLGEGFTDFTGGVFQTCDTNPSTGATSCITPSSNWAFDITDLTGTIGTGGGSTPEPASLLLLGTGLLPAFWRFRPRKS